MSHGSMGTIHFLPLFFLLLENTHYLMFLFLVCRICWCVLAQIWEMYGALGIHTTAQQSKALINLITFTCAIHLVSIIFFPIMNSQACCVNVMIMDEVSSPMHAQMLEFCDSDFFQETMQNNNSEVTSSSNCCYDENSPYNNNNNNNNNTNLSLPNDFDKYNQENNPNNITTTNTTNNNAPTTSTTSTNTATAANLSNTNSSNLSSLLFESQDELDNDISASIDFSSSPAFSVPQLFNLNQFDFTTTSIQPQQQQQLPFSDQHHQNSLSSNYYSAIDQPAVVPQFMVPSLLNSMVFEEDCFSSVPNTSSSYAQLNNPPSPSCSYLGPSMTTFMPSGAMNAALSADCSGPVFGGGFYTDQFQPQESDYQGDNAGIYCPNDSLQRSFNPSDLEAFNNETKQLVGGTTSSPPLTTTELTNLEESSFKVGKLSVEQRKEKINRYMKKRNERNFSKKIKYACRKTLADSRPRVRGRFAKNDDFGESNRAASGIHEDDDDGESYRWQ
ncbi:Zinc finger protein CONSTANS-LIKE 3 [Linum perenne]